MTPPPTAVVRTRPLVDAALEECLTRIQDRTLHRIASYQLGWCDTAGRPSPGHGGKALRSTLVLVGAEAAEGDSRAVLPVAAAIELVHNFSLLHDDVMDGDVERRHRPTGWAAFGTGPALLAGNAMLVAATEAVLDSPLDRGCAHRAVSCLLEATQRLISGQSEDLRLESAPDPELDDVMHMELGKTGALLECAASIGAVAVGAADGAVARLAGFGRQLGIAFQLVDDVLGIVGDPAITGKSTSSDIRSGKRSAPIVAALRGGDDAARRLGELLGGGPPDTEADVELAAKLVVEAGGIAWAIREAETRLNAALAHLSGGALRPGPVAELTAIAHYVVDRDR